MRNRTLLLGLYFTCSLFTCVTTGLSEEISIGETRTLQSKLLGEEREIWVSLPRSYQTDTDRKYPLYLTMDARAMFAPAASMARSLSSSGALPELIVVSIKNTNRWRDLTPTKDDNWPDSGGGENFLSFIQDELLPWLESNYRLSGYKVLSGHSLGGLTAFHSFAKLQAEFAGYVALSPTMRWSKPLLKRWQARLQSDEISSSQRIYLCLANEWEDRESLHEMLDTLASISSPDFSYKFDSFETTDDHHSVRVEGDLRGMRWIFKDYRLMPQQVFSMTDDQIKKHYEHTSKVYRTHLEFDIMQTTNAAYWGIRDANKRDRAMALFYRATEKWPDNAYGWSCLAEGLERIDNLPGALEAISKSIEIGEKTNFQDMQYLLSIRNRIVSKI